MLISAHADFIHAVLTFYFLHRGTTVTAEVDEVDLDDGTKVQPICVTFPEGNTTTTAQNQARFRLITKDILHTYPSLRSVTLIYK